MNLLVKYCVAALGLTLASSVLASGGSGPKVAEGVNYIPLEPALVVNYGGPGKARFIKAEISIRTETGEDAIEVTHHLPLIRDRLVSILSAQTEEAINSVEGKEYLRVYALAEINKALLKVEGHDVAEHDAKHGANEKNVGAKPTHEDAKQPEHHAEAAPAVPSIADIKPVKGPASDLYFNNFVVQK
ncbi:flagellar basal body-associated FliL family protein [Cellvibrio sp. OA-2007]|uniref:flagellar basal body-associated FliL family protein n=1 Tax=Cellvibrio sp. OA-2007 TaxID=529823 RepID=UPI0007840A09|nr:flagellar basal body-associated FliL family protein [Cellvibrio sp. OA-2007]